jgi:hypothetical protein
LRPKVRYIQAHVRLEVSGKSRDGCVVELE